MLFRSVDLIVMTGGLGPTEDDLSRFALGDVFTPNQPLVHDEDAEKRLRARYAKRGRSMPESNLRQVLRPEAMSFIANPNGTAMGLAGTMGGCRLFALPGPPAEMHSMMHDHVLPALKADQGDQVFRSRSVHCFGLGESNAAELLGDLTHRNRQPVVGLTVSESILTAQVRAIGNATAITPQIDQTIEQIEQRWAPYAYSRDGRPLAASVGDLLLEKKKSIVTAESCTGGWLGKALVDVPGSSAYYLGGWITYSNAMKSEWLGVPAALIDLHGAVSSQVAQAMAVGALDHTEADCAISITGIAGPEGGSEEKPVGTVFLGLAERAESDTPDCVIRQFRFPGDRLTVRQRSVLAALQMLRFHLRYVDRGVQLLWEVSESESARIAATSQTSS